MTKTEKKQKILQQIQILKTNYPEAHCELNYKTPFQLLIATILSAQCTDVRVNSVTEILFERFGKPEQLASASLTEIEQIIRPTGFFKNKAKNIKACAQQICELYQGRVPQALDLLIQLPGVGRKTANVVLGNAYGIPSGIVVDTHVKRLTTRFKWLKDQDPVKIEKKLMDLIPQEEWIMLSHYLIFHGRRLCKARNPSCEVCFLQKTCPSFKI